MIIRKTDIINSIAEATGLSKNASTKAFEAATEAITKALLNRDTVQIANFGTFEIRERAARTGRNPATGETMEIAASKNIAFKASKPIKEKLNG